MRGNLGLEQSAGDLLVAEPGQQQLARHRLATMGYNQVIGVAWLDDEARHSDKLAIRQQRDDQALPAPRDTQALGRRPDGVGIVSAAQADAQPRWRMFQGEELRVPGHPAFQRGVRVDQRTLVAIRDGVRCGMRR